MPDDAMQAAQAAALEARAAVTQIFSHERDCERRYQETSAQMERINNKLDELIKQGGISQGRSDASRVLLGGLPNALWSALIAAISAGIILFASTMVKVKI